MCIFLYNLLPLLYQNYILSTINHTAPTLFMSILFLLPVCTCSSEGMAKVKDVVKPFDWTFTTSYMGTVSSKEKENFKVKH